MPTAPTILPFQERMGGGEKTDLLATEVLTT